MMKKLLMIPLLALMLVACQSNTVEEAVEKEATDTEEKETNETEEDQKVNEENAEEEQAVDLTLYDEVIKEYEKLTETSLEEVEGENFEYVKNGALYNFYDVSLYEGVSASYYDLNDDGVDELLITLRFQSGVGSYSLVDLYTIVDGELVSIFTDDMSINATAKRSGFSFSENGNLIYTTASGRGERFGEFYELDEETMEYVETYAVSDEEGDFEKIEKELENHLDFTTLEWETIGKEKVRTAYDNFLIDDYSVLEGIWKVDDDKNDYHIKIEGNEVTFFDEGRANLDFSRQYSDETSSVFNLMDEEGFGALLYFYPENSDIEYGDVFVPSDTKQDRFFITQSDPPDEKGIYYKVSELDD